MLPSTPTLNLISLVAVKDMPSTTTLNSSTSDGTPVNVTLFPVNVTTDPYVFTPEVHSVLPFTEVMTCPCVPGMMTLGENANGGTISSIAAGRSP